MRPHTRTAFLRIALGGLIGSVLTFPASIATYFEWKAKYSGEIAWGLWAMVALGAIGGAVFRSELGLKPQVGRWVRTGAAVLVVGPSAVLMIRFAAFLLSW